MLEDVPTVGEIFLSLVSLSLSYTPHLLIGPSARPDSHQFWPLQLKQISMVVKCAGSRGQYSGQWGDLNPGKYDSPATLHPPVTTRVRFLFMSSWSAKSLTRELESVTGQSRLGKHLLRCRVKIEQQTDWGGWSVRSDPVVPCWSMGNIPAQVPPVWESSHQPSLPTTANTQLCSLISQAAGGSEPSELLHQM